MIEVAACGAVVDLGSLIASLASESAYVLLEEIPSCWLSPEAQIDALYFERYSAPPRTVGRTRGRVFSPDLELCWEWDDEQFQVRYVGAGPVPPGLQPYPVDLSHVREVRCSLWGASSETDQGKPTFVDLRIPRPLRYPVQHGVRRVQLVVREYMDPVSDMQILSRFVDVEEQET